MQGSIIEKWKRNVEPYKAKKLDASGGKEGSPDMEEENEDGWVEVQKLVPQQEPIKYVSKFPYPKRQQRSSMN